MTKTWVFVWIVVNVKSSDKAASSREIVEHRVFGKEALEKAGKLLLSEKKEPQPGCKKCTPEENFYCKGKSLLHDHCCCDRRHKEKFYFIPHVCYAKLSAMCEPIASDCEEYARLYYCCCRDLVAIRWKKFSIEFAINYGEKRNLRKANCLVSKMIALLAYFIVFR